MKKEYKGPKGWYSYEVGEHIKIHRHISDPDSWFLTVKPLGIVTQRLCKVDLRKDEIARHAYRAIIKVKTLASDLGTDIYPYT